MAPVYYIMVRPSLLSFVDIPFIARFPLIRIVHDTADVPSKYDFFFKIKFRVKQNWTIPPQAFLLIHSVFIHIYFSCIYISFLQIFLCVPFV